MALEATHIRFAVDLQDRYGILDMKKYIAGTVYPDSRYISGINRELTHPDDIFEENFLKDDFSKGWAVHSLCDRILNQIIAETFPGLSPSNKYHEWWAQSSAIKNVLDILVVKDFNVQPYLSYLDFVYNPNGEDVGKVKSFNEIIQRMYRGKKEITAEDCCEMWLASGVEKEKVEVVDMFTRKFLNDNKMSADIGKLYGLMLQRVV